MFTVIFVCLGNICRSPMAEAVFLRTVEERGVALSFRIISRATSDCEEGNPVYPPAQKVLRAHGYSFSHRAQKISLGDIKNADYVLVMDDMNLADIKAMTGGNYSDKIFKLRYFEGWSDRTAQPDESGKDIDDPWYTRDFERTYSEVLSSCNGFLDFLLSEHAEAFAYDKRH